MREEGGANGGEGGWYSTSAPTELEYPAGGSVAWRPVGDEGLHRRQLLLLLSIGVLVRLRDARERQ